MKRFIRSSSIVKKSKVQLELDENNIKNNPQNFEDSLNWYLDVIKVAPNDKEKAKKILKTYIKRFISRIDNVSFYGGLGTANFYSGKIVNFKDILDYNGIERNYTNYDNDFKSKRKYK